ncbi:MAG: hypothetical protein IKZ58_06595 [Selenomonadaceae bacterium]|nr:hypothetical protein [Selenomonadaceae bacterium]
MQKFSLRLFLITLLIILTSTSVSLAKEKDPDKERAELMQMSGEVLDKMSKKYPETTDQVENSYAYCTISSSSVKLGFWGSGHGRGVAINNETGEKVYVKMKEVTVGFNIGAKEYDLLFIITNKDTWDKFISGKIEFGTEVTAAATDGVSGDAYTNAKNVAKGVYVYQVDKKGLAVELTFKGARISPIRHLQ